MNKEKLQELVDFDIDDALKMFRRIYPEINYIDVVDVNDSKTEVIIFVGDGYHSITDKSVSQFYDNLEDAKRR